MSEKWQKVPDRKSAWEAGEREAAARVREELLVPLRQCEEALALCARQHSLDNHQLEEILTNLRSEIRKGEDHG